MCAAGDGSGVAVVSLANVWIQSLADGLVRADQVVGIDAHQTPALSGKPSRWLLDVVLPASTGSGTREQWGTTVLHRTLIQASEPLEQAPAGLARLLSQLDRISAAGVITVRRDDDAPASEAGARAERVADGEDLSTGASPLRFRFVPFASPAPGLHTGSEYL